MYIIEVTKNSTVLWTAVCQTQTALLKAVDDAKNKIPQSTWAHYQPNYNEVACYKNQNDDYIVVREPDVVYSL